MVQKGLSAPALAKAIKQGGGTTDKGTIYRIIRGDTTTAKLDTIDNWLKAVNGPTRGEFFTRVDNDDDFSGGYRRISPASMAVREARPTFGPAPSPTVISAQSEFLDRLAWACTTAADVATNANAHSILDDLAESFELAANRARAAQP